MTAAGEPRRLTPAALSADYPAWMPGRKEILFSAKGNLWRLAVRRRGPRPARLPFVGEDGLMPVVSRPSPGGRLGWSTSQLRGLRTSGASRLLLPARRPLLRRPSPSPPRDPKSNPSFLPTAAGSPSRRRAREDGRSGWPIPTGPMRSSSPPWARNTQAPPAGLPTATDRVRLQSRRPVRAST